MGTWFACGEGETRRWRGEGEEGHRSTSWSFNRESEQTMEQISTIAMSNQQNQRERKVVGKKWKVGAEDG